MKGRRVLFISALLLVAGTALAQEEPTVNDSDYDTSVPTNDETYLDDAEAESTGEPTLSDSDFDTSVPEGDDSYLEDAEREYAGADGAPARGTPGAAVWALLAALGGLALASRRRA